MTASFLEEINRGESFALCHLPNSNQTFEFLKVGNDLVDSEGRVWVAMPFGANENAKHIPVETTKEQHIHAVERAIQLLQQEGLDKVVVSKIRKVKLPFDVTAELLQRTFETLVSKYPSAFVFIYRMNVHSVWLGATPETLVRAENGIFQTMSLAGTRLKESTNIPWGIKEQREQQVVTDYILQKVNAHGGENIQVLGPETTVAAHLEHLKSTISFESKENIKAWAEALHPTPAVCGLPPERAKEVISEIELHARKMYAGYAGFIEKNGNGQFYVQLRCMEWSAGQAYIYSGGGIMPDSDPESEWREAENKAQVMFSILESLKN